LFAIDKSSRHDLTCYGTPLPNNTCHEQNIYDLRKKTLIESQDKVPQNPQKSPENVKTSKTND